MIKYYKLFDLLSRRGMKKTDLLEVITSPTLAKLSKGNNIQTDSIDKICLYLECQPGDIMECIHEETKEFADGRIIEKLHYNDSETEERVIITDPETFTAIRARQNEINRLLKNPKLSHDEHEALTNEYLTLFKLSYEYKE